MIVFRSTCVILCAWLCIGCGPAQQSQAPTALKDSLWVAPDTALWKAEPAAKEIRYGRELIAHTAVYIGPAGTVSKKANGMNCQNCHLDAGTRPFGNNYGSVASQYPKFRARSGTKESIEKRINDCLQRSLGGDPIDSLSREMRAMVSYILWVGSNVPKGQVAAGSGLFKMDWLGRAADTVAGKKLYLQKCQTCHGRDGQGTRHPNGREYYYPPVWGTASFTTAAGLHRISMMARYIRTNMPLGTTWRRPGLTDEEAWDIAAYLESMPRRKKVFTNDWPDIATKPVDYPFGPFADTFDEARHKYGPFKEMIPASR
ncbi:MAG: c-type cytochrome [Cyclobacteriaceae bacterium]|nr:c-type cytochrome [Cyclobacteriaceae bacterium]